MTAYPVDLILPDEASLFGDELLTLGQSRAMALIDVATTGVDDAWADARVMRALAKRLGWSSRIDPALRGLEKRSLVESASAGFGRARPHSRHTPKGGDLHRLTPEGRLEYTAHRPEATA